MSISTSVAFIPSGVPLEFAYENGGRVLVLKRALQHPETKRLHDIRIEQEGWLSNWWGTPFKQQITKEQAEQIRQTYHVVLQTIHAKPGEGSISFDLQQTKFTWKDPSDPSKTERRTSRAYQRGTPDTMLEPGAAQRLFKTSDVTVHDAMVGGILHPLGIAGAAVKSPTVPVASPPPIPASASAKWPKAVPSSYSFRSTPKEEGYDLVDITEQQRRVRTHLDKTGPVPFTPFTTNNAGEQIPTQLFQRMQESLQRLAAQAAAATDQQQKDDEYMRAQLRHWFRATYGYITKNSAEPRLEDPAYARYVIDPRYRNKAKEMYWRATTIRLLMPMMGPAFSGNYDRLTEDVRQDPLKASWQLL